jgi:uncharacterized membrane protein
MPFSLIYFFIFLLVLSFLLGIIQFGLVTLTLGKLGLTTGQAFLWLFGSLIGSAINIPIFRIRADPVAIPEHQVHYGLLRFQQRRFTGWTLIAVNVGGAVIPIVFSLYLITHSGLNIFEVLIAITLVAAICYRFSRPLPGLGIGMPLFIAPLAAALIALVINTEQSPPLAYISGTLGVLIGADLMRLKDVRKLGTPFAAIGGAGTFDGIFITGIIAVLLT